VILQVAFQQLVHDHVPPLHEPVSPQLYSRAPSRQGKTCRRLQVHSPAGWVGRDCSAISVSTAVIQGATDAGYREQKSAIGDHAVRETADLAETVSCAPS
jgi:hypothetical protein